MKSENNHCSDLPEVNISECRELNPSPKHFKWYSIDPNEEDKVPTHYLEFIGKKGNQLNLRDCEGGTYLIVDTNDVMQPYFDQIKNNPVTKNHKIFVEVT